MSPRRWTLITVGDQQYIARRPVGAEFKGDIPVREDIITTADVEVVAKHLAEIDRGAAVMEYASGYKDEARALLSLVLGSDKEGEDA